jgi:SAM-dependent MidA family methyltransferase
VSLRTGPPASGYPFVTWRAAMAANLAGPTGFYAAPGAAGRHFSTSAGRPGYARALVRLLDRVDAALGRPERLDFVDLGAADGRLAAAVRRLAGRSVAARLTCTAVEICPPPRSAGGLSWTHRLPEGICGLIVASEWLDTVPVQVVASAGDGPRVVEVAPDGTERLGRRAAGAELDWLARHWPLAGPGCRAEVGSERDAAWRAVLGTLTRGAALAVDYPVPAGGPPAGTLTGFRDGRQVRPVPGGTTDITAAVAFGSVAAAGAAPSAAGPVTTRQATQRRALRALWGPARAGHGTRGPGDPGEPARQVLGRLARVGEEVELTDPAGLGGHRWLVQTRGLSGVDLLGAENG